MEAAPSCWSFFEIYALVSLLVGQAGGRERALRLGDGDSRVLSRRGCRASAVGTDVVWADTPQMRQKLRQEWKVPSFD
jgi:hypothetical protein